MKGEPCYVFLKPNIHETAKLDYALRNIRSPFRSIMPLAK